MSFAVGTIVRLVSVPPYFKTADTMPMLRPNTLVQLQEEGRVERRHPGGFFSVRFANGIFLVDAQYLETV